MVVISQISLDLTPHIKGELCDLDTVHCSEGNVIVTGGEDGMIQLYKTQKSGDVTWQGHHDVDEEISAVGLSPDGKELAIGLVQSFLVKLYNIGSDKSSTELEVQEMENDSFLTRFTSLIHAVSYSPDGTRIAVCSEQEVRVVSRTDTSKTVELKGHDGGAKALAFDPSGQLLASTGFDGYVRIFKVDPGLDELECDQVHSFKCLEKEVPSRVVGKASTPHWHPQGNFLAVPGAKGVQLIQRDSWKLSFLGSVSASAEVIEAPICSLAYSPNGLFIASASLDGRLVVWDTKLGDPVEGRQLQDKNVYRMAWLQEEGANALAVMATDSSFGICKSIIPTNKGYPPPSGDPSKLKPGPENNMKKKAAGRSNLDEEENGNIFDGDNISQSVEEIKKSVFIDDAAIAEVEDSIEDEPVEDAVGAEKEEDTPQEEDIETGQIAEFHAPLQESFQPSSTPWNKNLRFLCWNCIGSITSLDQGTYNTIHIEFSDQTSSQKDQRFVDQFGFTMGSLSESGAVLASVKEERNNDPDQKSGQVKGHLYYVRTRSRNDYSWSKAFPLKEDPVAVAIGEGWVAAAMDSQLIRIFTTSGLQVEVLSIPGSIITVVGSKLFMAVFYHQGNPIADSQNIGYKLFKIDTQEEISSGQVAISPNTTLIWAGFSDSLVLMVMDSARKLFCLTKSFGWSWKPTLDGRKAAKGNGRIWPIGVVGQKLLDVMLKVNEEYPSAQPRSMISAHQLTVPLLQAGSELTAALEQDFIKGTRLMHQKVYHAEIGADSTMDVDSLEQEIEKEQINLDKAMIKAFQEACDDDEPNIQRALDLARWMHNEKSMEIALRVANHHGHNQLVNRVQHLIEEKFQSQEEEEEEEEEEEDEANTFEAHRRQRTLQSSKRGKENMRTLENLKQPKSPQPASLEDDDGDESDDDKQLDEGAEPEGNEDSDEPKKSTQTGSSIPVNPFSKKTVASPLKRKKSVFDTMSEVISSPSPKKVTLNRTSTFANEARTKRKHDRNVL